MAKFYGKIGFATLVEKPANSGVWVPDIETKLYSGDMIKNTTKFYKSEKVNEDIDISNKLSILANPYAEKNFMNIRYVEWQNVRWSVVNVSIEYPRYILSLGGVYNGPTEAEPT